MPIQLEKFLNWLQTRTKRELTILLSASLVVIYLLWYTVLANPLWNKQNTLTTHINAMLKTSNLLQTNVQALITIDNKTRDSRLAQENQQLTQKIAGLNQLLAPYKQQFVPPQQMLQALKSLATTTETIDLVRLENLPVIALNKTEDNVNERLFEHSFVIELRGDYFGILHYLEQLEALPWRLYWDELDYQVTYYPNAKVTLKLHILSNDEKLINV